MANEIQLTPPEPVEVVEPTKAEGMVRLEQETLSQLDVQVMDFVQDVMTLDVQSDDFKGRLNSIHNLGVRETMAAASVSNRLLERPAAAMSNGVFDENSEISKNLINLRNTLEDLDPSKQGDLLSPKKLLGFIPFGSKLQEYFQRYQSSQSHINAIIEALYRGQDELKRDNAAIEQEKVNMWALMQKLEQYIYMGKKIDEQIEAKVMQIETSDPEKARVVREELLFYARQKVQDLLTQMAVNIQGYLALDLIRKNNLELIKGVDRATTTTISALRTAVMVAQALANQKLVLDQINALNTTTSNMIESTSAMLKQQAGQIHQQAANSTIELEKLQNAFNNIYETMDMISTYKVEALENMSQTVNVLSEEVNKAQGYLDKVRAEQVQEATADMQVSEDTGVVKI